MASERKLSSTREKCFRFKASFSPCLSIELLRNDMSAIETELADMVTRTPNFFVGSPVAIDLEKMAASEQLDFERLKKLFLSHGMIPVGIRGGHQDQQNAAGLAGLPLVNIGKSTSMETIKTRSSAKSEPVKTETTKLITTPIRSGIQVSAKESDLIVTAQVSHGAELVAAGHIHVYGVLRGRALAGAHGNKEARIFCRQLEAELVSIAGYYLTKEEMSSIPVSDNMIQIYLENEQLQIKAV
jgi:septum site-determining protein MinC